VTNKDLKDAFGALGAEYIRDRLKEPSALRGLLRVLPVRPFLVVEAHGLTHYAGYTLHEKLLVRVCDSLETPPAIIDGDAAPTCLQCWAAS